MHVAHVIRSRKVRAWVVLITLAILVTLIAAFFLQSRRSPKTIEMDDLYGLLD
jgi:disulfide bond formation protein DsbB